MLAVCEAWWPERTLGRITKQANMLSASAPHQNSPLLVIEAGLSFIALASAFAWPWNGAGWVRRLERAFGRLAERRGWSVTVCGLSVLAMRLALLPVLPVPLPFVPDDFSFLLAADTFAHGRLTNPTPAMWRHFESIHITMKPTYMSMYFPGQGLLLAAGKVMLGSPWLAVLLSSALMCAALCWALQAWLPAKWALLGGLIAVLHLGVFSYWTNTYHAAASLSALGGALVLGGLPRVLRTARLRFSALMGLGMVILALTRPYEGILLCLPVVVAVVRWMVKGKNRPSLAGCMRLAAAPLALVIGVGAWMGYYDYRAFGNPLTPPYAVNRAQYGIAPYYVWQKQRPEPDYRYVAMRNFYHDAELDFYSKIHSVKGFVPQTLLKASLCILFYAGFALLLPMLMVRRVFLDRRIRFLVVGVLILAAGMVIENFLLPHYVAPFTVAFYAIGLQAMRHLRVWKPEGKPVGLTLTRFSVALVVLMFGLRIFADPLHLSLPAWPPGNWNFTWYGPGHFGVERARVESQLEQQPGGQLAIVRYSPDHYSLDEWVYNSADIDASKVVWAREMDAADNLKLIQYYKDRKVWLIEPDTRPVEVVPYPVPAQGAGAAH